MHAGVKLKNCILLTRSLLWTYLLALENVKYKNYIQKGYNIFNTKGEFSCVHMKPTKTRLFRPYNLSPQKKNICSMKTSNEAGFIQRTQILEGCYYYIVYYMYYSTECSVLIKVLVVM